MSSSGIRLEFIEDGIALVTMCNGENKFNPDYVQRWHEILDTIERFAFYFLDLSYSFPFIISRRIETLTKTWPCIFFFFFFRRKIGKYYWNIFDFFKIFAQNIGGSND